MDAPLTLTFGVEFEFVVRYDPAKYEPYMSSANGILWYGHGEEQYLYKEEKLGMMVRAHIIAALHKYGFPVNRYNQNGEPERGYQKWGVTRDGSIYPGPDDGDPMRPNLRTTGVELQTPAYLLNSYAINQIEQVLKLLTTHFDVSVNSSCGLHVHVGNGDKGLPVQTLKNFCFLIGAFERQLNSLHPLHRIQNEYAKPLSQILSRTSAWTKLLAIDALNTVEQLVELFNTFDRVKDAHVAYNLANLAWTSKKTIEFRQHAATLDPTAVIKWVQTVTGLVSLSNTTPYPVYGDLLQHIDDSSFSVFDLLHTLNLHEAADYYAARGIWDHELQSWDWVDPALERMRDLKTQMALYEEELANERLAAGLPVSSPAIVSIGHESGQTTDEEHRGFSFSDEDFSVERQPLLMEGDKLQWEGDTLQMEGEPLQMKAEPLPAECNPFADPVQTETEPLSPKSEFPATPPPTDEEFFALQTSWLDSFYP